MSIERILILNNTPEKAEALERYIRFVLGLKNVEIYPINDPYRQKETFEKARESDLVVVDGFTEGEPKGFKFAKIMEKRTLALFYFREIEIEEEGPFWLVLPYALDRLGNKIKELLEQPAPDEEEYVKLENRFPELTERKGHHR